MGVTTLTLTLPSAWAGTVTVMEVSLFTVKLLAPALTAPNNTSVAPVRLTPVRVRVLPPRRGPEAADKLSTNGYGDVPTKEPLAHWES